MLGGLVSAALVSAALVSSALAATVVALPTPARAATAELEDFHGTGNVTMPSPVVSVTEQEFAETCAVPVTSQGVDAYIFELPSAYATASGKVTVRGSSVAPYDLDVWFWASDCRYLPTSGFVDGDPDETGSLPRDTRFIEVRAYTGVDVVVTLDVIVGPAPSPTPSPTSNPVLGCTLPPEGDPPAGEANWPEERVEVTRLGAGYLVDATFPTASSGRIASNSAGAFFASEDGGAVWAKTGAPELTFLDIDFVDPSHGWGMTPKGDVGITRDGGRTWAKCPAATAPGIYANAIDFIDELRGWVAGYVYNEHRSYIYATMDGGLTWTLQTVMDDLVSDLTFLDPTATSNPGSVIGIAGGGGVSLRTEDGVTWSPSPTQGYAWKFAAGAGTTFYEADYSGRIYKSTDAGISWEQIAYLRGTGTAIDWADGTLYAVGSGGMLQASRDEGDHWRVIRVPVTSNLIDVSAISAERAVAVGAAGTVIRLTLPPPEPLAAIDRYYFHHGDDDAHGTFSTTAPAGDQDSIALDDAATASDQPNDGADPSWTGSIDGAIQQIDLDLWVKQPTTQGAQTTGDFSAVVWIGEGPLAERYEFPFSSYSGPGETVTHVTAKISDIYLSPAGEPVSISIVDGSRSPVDPVAVFYDSEAHPSGFTINDEQELACSQVAPSEHLPNDTCAAAQWGLGKINAPDAWQEQQATGDGISVAIIDTGLDTSHPDFACPGKVRVLEGADLPGDGEGVADHFGHGTHVAGIIGACTNNHLGVAGVAPESTLLPIQVFSADETYGNDGNDNGLEDLADAIVLAADQGAHVINMSLAFSADLPFGGMVGLIPAMVPPEVAEALTYAHSKGVVIVAAAGNDESPLCNFPAFAAEVICVGATDPNDQKSYYSAFAIKSGSAVVAPGGANDGICDNDILSTVSLEFGSYCADTGYDSFAGTSMASPHVAGTAALLYERLGGQRSLENAKRVTEAITSTARDLGALGYDPRFGNGLVDALAAVKSLPVVSPPTIATEVVFTATSAHQTYFSDVTTLEAKLTDGESLQIGGATLYFDLGPDIEPLEAVTNEDGIAAVQTPASLAPGTYEVTVRYEGSERYEAASGTSELVVEREITEMVLSVGGTGSNRTVVASLTEDDGPVLAARSVTLYVDGNEIDSQITDNDGVVRFNIPARYKGGKHTFEARWDGDDYYQGAVATQAT